MENLWSFYSTILCASGFLLLLYYNLYSRHKFGEKVIPGPYCLPLLGYWPFIRGDGHRQFLEMSRKYGKIFKIHIGTKPALVLNDWSSIHEALVQQAEVFSGRPDLYAFRIRTNYKDIVGQNSTPAWKHQRRFAFNTLKDMGMGKSIAEMVIMEEVEKLTTYLANYSGKIILAYRLFFTPVVNILWHIIAGVKFEYGNTNMDMFASILQRNFEFLDASSTINVFPILRHFSNHEKEFRSNNDKIKELLKHYIAEHKASFNSESEPKDYIEAYLQQLHAKNKNGFQKEDAYNNNHFTEERLLGDLYVFFHAGSEATANTLSTAILYLSVWPNIQKKVHLEIDQTIGKSKSPHYTDRLIMPYTCATILEVQRYASLNPLAVPHITKTATKLCGYHIPAYTTVLPNIWALHHDPELWGDPEVFRPERFLDVNGQLKKPDYFIPFSAGARRCIGEFLAKTEIFLMFSSVLQRFTFSLPEGHPLPSLEPIYGLTLRPRPFSVLVESRS